MRRTIEASESGRMTWISTAKRDGEIEDRGRRLVATISTGQGDQSFRRANFPIGTDPIQALARTLRKGQVVTVWKPESMASTGPALA
jgi:hypothetical protein